MCINTVTQWYFTELKLKLELELLPVVNWTKTITKLFPELKLHKNYNYIFESELKLKLKLIP